MLAPQVCKHQTDEAKLNRKVSVVLRLLLVEDHAAFGGALAFMLNRQPDLEVAAQCGSLAECRGLGGFADIDVALLDLYLPDGDGTELIGELHQANPHVKVLILTGSVESPGADG